MAVVIPGPDALLRALAEAGLAAPPELGPLLSDRLEEARASHPDLALDPFSFMRKLAGPLAEDHDLVAALVQIRIADLYLAHGCALGSPAALAAFEAIFGGEIRALKARLRRGEAEGDDLAQAVRQRLFAPPRPRIGDYAGRGDLRNWLRVALVRMLVDHQRSTRAAREREVLDEASSLTVPTPEDDLELAYLKRRYGDAFRAAFEVAAGELEPETRNLLRRAYADGLTIDELGHLYRVHRATAARRLAQARAELLLGTRRRLSDQLGLDRGELDSIMRLIESTVHVTAERVFATR